MQGPFKNKYFASIALILMVIALQTNLAAPEQLILESG
jgi:hypothetical protein